MRAIITDVEYNGIAHIDSWNQLYVDARASGAKLIGSQAHQIAFQKNTTEGISTVANGIHWAPGDNIVLARGEFPANVYPWLNQAPKGVEINWVEAESGRLSTANFAEVVNRKTRVLSVSSVQFFAGYRSDLQALSALCKDHGILFVVDAIQSLGVLPLNVEETGIDVLCADGHKWMLAPEGCAYLFCSQHALDALHISSLGWASVESAHDFLSYDQIPHPDARRFESGTQNTAGIAGLKAATDFLVAQGIDTISKRVLMLTDRLCCGLERRGYSILSSRKDGHKSGIVTFKHPTLPSLELYNLLLANRIQGTERAGYIRLSPHFYNTEEEIDKVLALLSMG